MKYTVIIGERPYTVIADGYDEPSCGTVITFYDGDYGVSTDWKKVAEFKRGKIDGIIFEDNNLNED